MKRRRVRSRLHSAAIKGAAAKRDAQVLSSDEIDRRIVRAVLARVPAGGRLSIDDILRMDVPKGAITPQRVKRCIDLAREIDPAVATVEAFA